MSNELRIRYSTGKNLYAIILDFADYTWNGSALAPLTTEGWSTFAIALTEIGTTGVYVGNMPAAAAGVYAVLFFLQAGETVAVTDRDIGVGELYWDGAAESHYATTAELEARTLLAASYSTVTDDSIKTALEANGSKLDHVWDLTEESGGLRQLTAAALVAVRTATGLASANLDTQFDEVIAAIATALATVRGADSDTLKTLKDALTSGIDITQTTITTEGDNIYSEGS